MSIQHKHVARTRQYMEFAVIYGQEYSAYDTQLWWYDGGKMSTANFDTRSITCFKKHNTGASARS